MNKQIRRHELSESEKDALLSAFDFEENEWELVTEEEEGEEEPVGSPNGDQEKPLKEDHPDLRSDFDNITISKDKYEAMMSLMAKMLDKIEGLESRLNNHTTFVSEVQDFLKNQKL